MKYKKIDGADFRRMMEGGLSFLSLHEKEINEMNVFPVLDGDTGTNMRRTVEAGVSAAAQTTSLNEYLKGLSEGMLLGARGNSGVILSQIFAGFYDALTHYSRADADNFCTALVKGYRWAYRAVLRPVEGTILTVVREGAERTKAQLYRQTTVEEMLGILISEMQKTLLLTPEMLSVLKDAGVLDSGGFGFIQLTQGMLKGLLGEKLQRVAPRTENTVSRGAVFDENSDFTDGYCLEFLLQLMKRKGPSSDFACDAFTERIKEFGNSIVVVQSGKRVKVHVHTLCPERVISFSRHFGEFVCFKMENMQLQHNEFINNKKQPHKPFATLVVSEGDGFLELFTGQQANLVIDGGASMNTSVKEFLDAFERLNADVIAVIPNDKNVVLAAQQAAGMFQGGRIEIIPTGSMVQGYFALASDICDAPVEERIRMMRDGMDGVSTVSVHRCAKERKCYGVNCKEGGYAAFLDGSIVLSDDDAVTAAVNAVMRVKDIQNKEQAVVFTGKNFSENELLEEKLNKALPDLQVYFVRGGQSSDELSIGVT